MRQSPHRVRSSSRRRGPHSEAGARSVDSVASPSRPTIVDDDTTASAGRVDGSCGSTPPVQELRTAASPQTEGASQLPEAFDLSSLPILSSPDATWRGGAVGDEFDAMSAMKTSRAALCGSCGAASPYSPTTSSMSLKATVNQADMHLSELVRRIQASPDSRIFWKELRAYLLAQREEERRHGVQLQADLPIVSFSEDGDFVSTQIEVRALIAREPIRRARSSNRSTPMTSTSPTPRTGRGPLSSRGVPGTARPRSSSEDLAHRSAGNSPTITAVDEQIVRPAHKDLPVLSDDEDSEHLKVLAMKLKNGKDRRPHMGSPGVSASSSGRTGLAEALAQLQVFEDDDDDDDDGFFDDDDGVCEGAQRKDVTPCAVALPAQVQEPVRVAAPTTPPPLNGAAADIPSPPPLLTTLSSLGHNNHHVLTASAFTTSSPPTSPHAATYLYKQLKELKQRTSFLKVAVDPANRVFLRELQAFEEQLRHAAEREFTDSNGSSLGASLLTDPMATSASSLHSAGSAVVAPAVKKQTSRPVISAPRHLVGSHSSPSSPSAATRSDEPVILKPIVPKISIGTVKRRAAAPDMNPEPNFDRLGRSSSSSAINAADHPGASSSAAPVEGSKFVRSHTDVSSVAIRHRRASHSDASGNTASTISKFHRIGTATTTTTTTTK